MFDRRVLTILTLSDRRAVEPAPVADREAEFASLCKQFFPAPPEQPDELANYGFGLKQSVRAVLPYCISAHARQPVVELSQDPKLAALLARIEPYPIFAGSAVFLGANHPMCDDLDLVQYIFVGAGRDERLEVATGLRKMVVDLDPASLKASLNNTSDGPQVPPQIARGRTSIRDYLDELLGSDASQPDPKLVARLASAQIAWPASAYRIRKVISLQLHFIHQSFVDKDIHPYQETHECDAAQFLHSNRYWLDSSFRNYFGFLFRGIQQQLVNNDIIKAAKRAAVLSGLVGNTNAQNTLISHLMAYPDGDETGQQRIRDMMRSIIIDVQKAAANAFKS